MFVRDWRVVYTFWRGDMPQVIVGGVRALTRAGALRKARRRFGVEYAPAHLSVIEDWGA